MDTIRKHSMLLFALLLFSGGAWAQEKDSTSCKKGEGCCIMKCMSGHGDDHELTFFGGPMANYTNTGLQPGKGIGGGGGAMTSCGLFVGAFGKGTSTRTNVEGYEEMEVDAGYGGLWIGGHPFRDKLIHPMWSVKAGFGGVSGEAVEEISGEEVEAFDQDIFVAEPELGVGVNLGSHLMLNIGAGYRFVHGFEGDQQLGISGKDLNGFQANVGVSFGSF